MKWKNIHCIHFLCITMALFALSASAEEAMGWYCVRNREHRQPQIGGDLAWVEQYGGVWLDHAHGDECADRVLYLTFDAGYENGNVARVLDALKEEGVPGAFFILGNLIEREPDLVRRMATEGHMVVNHTFHHPDMTGKPTCEAFAAELTALEEAYTNLTGETMPRYYRPPEGKFDRKTMEWANTLGYKTIFWSFAYADWDNAKQPDPAAAKEKILANVHNGGVILLHPTSATNAAILGEVIRTLKADGWRFGTLDELCAGGR